MVYFLAVMVQEDLGGEMPNFLENFSPNERLVDLKDLNV